MNCLKCVCWRCERVDKKMSEISKKIRELRKSLKLTQSEFAELVHLSGDSIGKIERGIGIPTIETLKKIAVALRVPIEDLVYPSKKKLSCKFPKELEDMLAFLQTLSPADIRFMHELAVKIIRRKNK